VAGNDEPNLMAKAIQSRFNHCRMHRRCIPNGWLDTRKAQVEERLCSVMRFVWAIRVMYIIRNSVSARFPPENKAQWGATGKCSQDNFLRRTLLVFEYRRSVRNRHQPGACATAFLNFPSQIAGCIPLATSPVAQPLI